MNSTQDLRTFEGSDVSETTNYNLDFSFVLFENWLIELGLHNRQVVELQFNVIMNKQTLTAHYKLSSPVKEGFFSEDHAGEHAAQTPHVQAVVVHLVVHQQLGTLEIPAHHPWSVFSRNQ